jgi:hypothetical protein
MFELNNLIEKSKKTLFKNREEEFDADASKFIIGFIAFFLPLAVMFITSTSLQSISASYHEGFWPRDIFVGFLFMIGALLFTYNGRRPLRGQENLELNCLTIFTQCQGVQKLLSKIAGGFAIFIAIFPCKCIKHQEIIPKIHGISAALLFFILFLFCLIFLIRAGIKIKMSILEDKKPNKHPKYRQWIYGACAFFILLGMVLLLLDHKYPGIQIVDNISTSFLGEWILLWAFAFSWSTSSQLFWFRED